MNNKKLLAVSLAFPILLLVLWTISLAYYYHTSQKTVFIAATGYDPRDLLSGHYVRLQPDWKASDCTQFEENICPKEAFKNTYRYYMSQEDAKAFEALLADASIVKNVQLQFIFTDNQEPVLKELFLDGMPWRDYKASKAQQKD